MIGIAVVSNPNNKTKFEKGGKKRLQAVERDDQLFYHDRCHPPLRENRIVLLPGLIIR
jgi:hypothetical protein